VISTRKNVKEGSTNVFLKRLKQLQMK